MRSSWIDDEKTVRTYRFIDNTKCVVQNEYRPVKCPQCEDIQYCRLTHIWHYDSQDRCQLEYHINFGVGLQELRELLITRIDKTGVTEVEDGGKWFLMKGSEKIGEQI